MSDFLTNLVARNLEPATEIKPRLASLYEPPQPVGGILYGPASGPLIGPKSPFASGLEETAETVDAAPFNPAERVLTEQQRRAQSLASNQATRQISSRRQRGDARDSSISDLSPEPSQPPPSFISPASAARLINWSTNQPPQTQPTAPPPETSSQTRSGPKNSQLVPATASDEARTGPATRSTGVERTDASAKVAPAQELAPSPVQTPDAARQRTRARETEHSLSRDESDALDQRSAGHETRAAINSPLTPHLSHHQDASASGETHTPAGVFIRPQVTRKSEPDPTERVAAPQETAPTINVTIGRIEVRANTSTESKPRPQQKQTPTTSLDEYLRQRAQGVKR
jgi:hypothetical protein